MGCKVTQEIDTSVTIFGENFTPLANFFQFMAIVEGLFRFDQFLSLL